MYLWNIESISPRYVWTVDHLTGSTSLVALLGPPPAHSVAKEERKGKTRPFDEARRAVALMFQIATMNFSASVHARSGG